MDIIKIAIIGISSVLLAAQFKNTRNEYTVYIITVAIIIIFYIALSKFQLVVDTINKIGDYLNLNTAYIDVLLKIIGITYIAEISSGICKDAGYQGIASQIEIFAKLSILAVSMPIVLALLDTISQFLS